MSSAAPWRKMSRWARSSNRKPRVPSSLVAGAGRRANPAVGDAALCRARHVERLVHFTGPDSVRNELVIGLGQASTAFASTLIPGGFRTGAMGLGHAVLSSTDEQQAASFYRDVLGMAREPRAPMQHWPDQNRRRFSTLQSAPSLAGAVPDPDQGAHA